MKISQKTKIFLKYIKVACLFTRLSAHDIEDPELAFNSYVEYGQRLEKLVSQL